MALSVLALSSYSELFIDKAPKLRLKDCVFAVFFQCKKKTVSEFTLAKGRKFRIDGAGEKNRSVQTED